LKSLRPAPPKSVNFILKNFFCPRSDIRRLLYFLSFVFILIPSLAGAAQVSLSWARSTGANVAGYKMHYGNYSGHYQYTVDVGNSNSCTISGLDEGTTYYFSATAYDTQQNESGYSNEVTYYVSSKGSQQKADEIIGTWSTGIWYWDAAASKWTKMTSTTTSGDIAGGDFTGDGKADVAACWDSGLWYQNGANLGWKKVSSLIPYNITAGDITGDGRREIIGTWDSGIWYWDAAKSKWTQMTSTTTSGDIAAGDFTGDGKADVASNWSSGLWYQNGTTLGWTKVSSTASDKVTAGDITGDGRAEIIGTWDSGIWYRNVAASSWKKMTSSIPTGDIAAGDFTGDGKADVASCWDSGLWYQSGATLGWTKVTSTAPDKVTAGDVTGN
jgi:hypothetical protein